MITVTVTPRGDTPIYQGLVAEERELRRKKLGTLHRRPGKSRSQVKWAHVKFPGRITMQKCIGNVIVASVQSGTPTQEWQLLSSFVGFLDRHFRDDIAAVNISYGAQ